MVDKRKLVLEVDVDADSKPLRDLGTAADKAEDDFDDLNKGLKRLDDQFRATTGKLVDLRKEFARTGDDALLKDIQRAEREYKKLGKDTKAAFGFDPTQVVKAGAEAGSLFGTAFSGGLSGVLRSPAGIGAITAAGAAAAPFIGGVVGAAVLGSAAGGGIIGGVVLAGKSPAVKAAAGSLSTEFGERLKLSAKPFEAATIGAIGILRGEVRKAQPDLDRLFSSTSKFVVPLTRDLGSGARSFLDGVADAAENAGPVVRELGDGLERLGVTSGEVFSRFGEEGPSAAIATRDGFSFVNDAISITGKQLAFLGSSYGFARAAQSLFTGDLGTFSRYVTDSAVAAAEAKRKQEELAAATLKMSVGYTSVNDAARTAAEGAKLFNDTISGLVSGQLGLDKANLAAKQGFADLRTELNEGKRTLSENSQAGRDNRQAILDQIAVLEQQRSKQIETTGTVGDANRKFNDGVEAIGENAAKLKFNKDEVQKLIDKYKLVPGDVSTDVHANTKAATTQVNNFITRLERLDGTVATTYVKTVDLGGGAYRASSSGGGGRSIEPRAGGGDVNAGQTYLVGEQGKELFTPKVNGYVHDAKTTAAMAASAGPGSVKVRQSPANLTININAGFIASAPQLKAEISRIVNDLNRRGHLDPIPYHR